MQPFDDVASIIMQQEFKDLSALEVLLKVFRENEKRKEKENESN